jgi:peptidyl-prolyl cis-trans isomerase B (cyclophilin B)
MQQGATRQKTIHGVLALIAIGAIAAILGGCGGGSDSTSTGATTADTGACKEVEAPAPKEVSLKAPPQTVKKGEKLTAVVQTSCGTFDIALDSTRAPKTVNSFAYLAEEGFYDDLTFHRIAPGFVIQGGDPLGNGSGGPGYSVDEKPPANLAYTKGTVAMAKTTAEPPGRSGSQFYVVTAADAGLPPEYALVGKVSKGYDVVTKIEKLGPEGQEGPPKQTVLIEKMTIEKG